MVAEDPSLLASDSEEDTDPRPPPPNWPATVRQIERHPQRHHAIKVQSSITKLNGIYVCRGIFNKRPYYQKRGTDTVIWFDGKEDIWVITDASDMTEKDPGLFGYIDATAWDLSLIDFKKDLWKLATPQGGWFDAHDLSMTTVQTPPDASASTVPSPATGPSGEDSKESSGSNPRDRSSPPEAPPLTEALRNLPVDPQRERTEDANYAREVMTQTANEQQHGNLMAMFHQRLEYTSKQVKENKDAIKKIGTKQDRVIRRQQGLLARVTALEGTRRNRASEAKRMKESIEELKNQLKEFGKKRKREAVAPNQALSEPSENEDSDGEDRPKPKRKKRRRRNDSRSVSFEALCDEGKGDSATVAQLKDFLRHKQKRGYLLNGKKIVLSGKRADLLARAKEVQEKAQKAPRKKTKWRDEEKNELERERLREQARIEADRKAREERTKSRDKRRGSGGTSPRGSRSFTKAGKKKRKVIKGKRTSPRRHKEQSEMDEIEM